MSKHTLYAVRRQKLQGQFGFTLLEAMIALVVLSVGLLGLAALQARSMQYNHDALTRSQASMIASEIMDRMRSRAYDMAPAPAETALAAYLAPATTADCVSPPITAVQEKGCWLRAIQTYLPNSAAPQGTITTTASSNTTNGDPSDDVYLINMRWTDRSTQPPQTITQSFAFQP
jgi:type IV pilus assembly protein PilV